MIRGLGTRGRIAGAALLGAATCAVAAPPPPTVVAAVLQVAQQAEGETLPTVQVDVEPLLYSVRVNGQDMGDVVLLRMRDGRLLARRTDFLAWSLRPLTSPPFVMDGEDYWILDEVPGYAVELDPTLQQASLRFAPSAFVTTRRSVRPDRLVTAQRPDRMGGFLNYEFVGLHSAPDAGDAVDDLNADVELALFGPRGVATSQWVALGVNRAEADASMLPTQDVIRLDTAWRMDDPDAMTTLRVGDGAGASGLWGRPVLFGGLQWARNFRTQPGFVVLPQPALTGETSLPSVLDLYIDGVRRQSVNVPPGPFVVESVPAVSAMGDVEIVVRDLLGREQVLSLPYLSGARQLRSGLHDWSYEVGAVRENFGRESDDYGEIAATGQHRYGFNDALTGEGRLEVREQTGQTAGLGMIGAVPVAGVFTLAGAYSRDGERDGTLGLVAWERIVRSALTLSARAQFTSTGFMQSGFTEDFLPPSRILAGNVGLILPRNSSASVAYASQRTRTAFPDTELVSLRLSARLGAGTASLFALERLQPEREYTVGITYTVPLLRQNYLSAAIEYDENEAGEWLGEGSMRLRRNAPQGEGWGYRMDLNTVAGNQAGVTLNGPHGSYGAEASFQETQSTYRGTVSGGLGAWRGHGFATRRITSSFGLIEAGAEGIPVLLNNQHAGETGADGSAVIPNLQEYHENEIRIDVDDVPLEVEVREPVVLATPYYRSGALIALPVTRSQGATITLQFADGKPVPAGASVVLKATGREFPVGKDGLTFVSDLQPGPNVLDVRLRDATCVITVELPAGAGVQPLLGPYQCAP